MIRVYSPEETMEYCKQIFGGYEFAFNNFTVHGVHLDDYYKTVPKDMVLKILDIINKKFPLYWADVDIFCVPFRPMIFQNNSWTGLDFNGQAKDNTIVLGARPTEVVEREIASMVVHELFHSFAYKYIDPNPFDLKDTPEYIKFKKLMSIENYSDKDLMWENRPSEILAELGRYFMENELFTWEEFLPFRRLTPKKEAFEYLISLMPPKTNTAGGFIEKRNPKEDDNMPKKIGTDKGHGGKDPGSIGSNGLQEKDVTLNVGLKLDELLSSNGFKVITTRIEDIFLELKERTDILNKAKCDVAISIHVNSFADKDSNYISTFIQGKGGQAEILANHVQKYLVETTKWKDGKVKVKNLHMTRETDMPACLVELGFISNLEQEKWLSDKNNQDKLAAAICKGVCDYYKIEYKENKEENKVRYKGYKIIDELPIILDGEEIKLKAAKIETPQGGVTFLPIRDFLQDIIRDKYGIDFEIGYDGRILLNNKKKSKVITERQYDTNIYWIKFAPTKIKARFVYENGKKVSELVKKYDADYGFNFPFFSNGIPLGNVYDGENIINRSYGKMLKWSSFSFINDKPMIGRFDINDNMDFLVQGTPLLIENGNLCYEYYIKHDQTALDIAQSRCQRTAVGIDGEGNLIVAVCDGRTSENKGLSLRELSLFMQSKDCKFALNGDGGLSSILVDKNGKMINNQSEQRIVHHAILINEL